MQINFISDVQQRLKLYESEVKWFERLAREAADDNSRRHWEQRAEEWKGMAERLRGA